MFMQLYKAFIDEILTDVTGVNDDDLRERVELLTGTMYERIVKEISISNFRTNLDLDFTDIGENGIILPSNLFGIDAIKDETNNIEFILRNSSAIEVDEYAYKAYTYHPSQDPLYYFQDLLINSGGTTFESDDLAAIVAGGVSVVDEWIRIGGENGYYQITEEAANVFTISPKYYGRDRSDEIFVVRPPETNYLVILDPNDIKLQDREITLYYWTAPRPLTKDTNTILLADTKLLKLKVLREMPEAKKRRPVSDSEIREARSALIKLNPSDPRTQSPRDKHNRLFDFRTNMYTGRGRNVQRTTPNF